MKFYKLLLLSGSFTERTKCLNKPFITVAFMKVSLLKIYIRLRFRRFLIITAPTQSHWVGRVPGHVLTMQVLLQKSNTVRPRFYGPTGNENPRIANTDAWSLHVISFNLFLFQLLIFFVENKTRFSCVSRDSMTRCVRRSAGSPVGPSFCLSITPFLRRFWRF